MKFPTKYHFIRDADVTWPGIAAAIREEVGKLVTDAHEHLNCLREREHRPGLELRSIEIYQDRPAYRGIDVSSGLEKGGWIRIDPECLNILIINTRLNTLFRNVGELRRCQRGPAVGVVALPWPWSTGDGEPGFVAELEREIDRVLGELQSRPESV